MPLIAWNEDLSVQIESIDEQHQKLIAMLNELFTALKNDEEKAYLQKLLQGLADYTVEHFRDEEKLMQDKGYPEYAEHKTQHEGFVTKVSEFKEKFEAGEEMLAVEVLDFISDWIYSHIMGVDQKYSAFLLEKGVQ